MPSATCIGHAKPIRLRPHFWLELFRGFSQTLRFRFVPPSACEHLLNPQLAFFVIELRRTLRRLGSAITQHVSVIIPGCVPALDAKLAVQFAGPPSSAV